MDEGILPVTALSLTAGQSAVDTRYQKKSYTNDFPSLRDAQVLGTLAFCI